MEGSFCVSTPASILLLLALVPIASQISTQEIIKHWLSQSH